MSGASHLPKETVIDVPFPSWEAWCDLRNGPLMPRLESDRALYESQRRFAADHVTHIKCVSCAQRFSDENCFTQEGWQETQISGLCERCFDSAMQEVPDDDHCPDCGYQVCSCDDDECEECGRRNCICDLDEEEPW